MACWALILVPMALAQTEVQETRLTLEKWVEMRGAISKARTDWQTDKEILEQTITLYERELASLAAQMSNVSTNNAQVLKERAEAMEDRRASEEAIDRARQFAVEFEVRLKQVMLQLPEPLQGIVRKEIARMPENPADTKMLAAERVQVCVSILNELDKFNSAVNLFSEKRKNDRGEEVAVDTVYVGLGAAYFVNEANDFAGMGAPSVAGWEWTANPELAATVRQVVKIYRSEHAPSFVKLPVVLH